MRIFELGDVIAERRFVFRANAGWSRDVDVKLGRPVPDSMPGQAWVCPFQISGLDRERVMGIFGADAMQALLLAIHTIPVELAVFARKAGGKFLRHGEVDTTLLSGCRAALEHADGTFPRRAD